MSDDVPDVADGPDQADAEVEPTSVTRYWQFADGSVTMQTASPPSAMVPPEGGTEIDAEAAQELLSKLAEAARLAAVSAAATQSVQTKDDYDALIALGMPDATARRLSQYTEGDS